MSVPVSIRSSQGAIREVALPGDLPLSQGLYAVGEWPAVALCQGLGRCGRCRVRFLAEVPAPLDVETRLLAEAELADGVRLACRHMPATGQHIELLPIRTQPARRFTLHTPADAAHPANALLAVDLGTTSVQWRALSPDGEVLAEGSELNPQLGAGSEVMSRMAYAAAGGAGKLRRAVLEMLLRIAGALPFPLAGMCLAANPAMTYIALGLDTACLRFAPYGLTFGGAAWRTLDCELPRCYVPPLPGPFVGGDASAGLAAIASGALGEVRYPFVLADLGTNGEFILAVDETTLLAASVPMGPALEGIGLSCGVMAEPGAVSGFDLSPAGLTRRCVEGCSAVAGTLPAPPAGLTGTAYLSLIGVLLRHGVLDERGVFGQGATPLAARIAARQGERRGEPCLDLGDGLYLAAGDVEEVLKVKAAFNLALQRLLQAAELSTSGLVTVYLAGAMGRHVVPADLERLGFLPPDGAGRCAAVGNASLTGAGALLLDEGLRERLHILSASVRVLDLAADTDFDAAYLRRMVFEYV